VRRSDCCIPRAPEAILYHDERRQPIGPWRRISTFSRKHKCPALSCFVLTKPPALISDSVETAMVMCPLEPALCEARLCSSHWPVTANNARPTHDDQLSLFSSRRIERLPRDHSSIQGVLGSWQIQTKSIKTYSKGLGGESMATEMRKTGVDAVGDVVSWRRGFLFLSDGKRISGLCHGAGF
jgi:hypothetical protein